MVERNGVRVGQCELGSTFNGIVEMKILPPEDSPPVGQNGFGFYERVADGCARFDCECAPKGGLLVSLNVPYDHSRIQINCWIGVLQVQPYDRRRIQHGIAVGKSEIPSCRVPR